MPQLTDNRINDTSQQNMDISAILKTLLDNSAQVQAQSLGEQDKVQQQRNAYQMGVEKALKKAGETHTFEAIQQGVPPEHIVEQSGLQIQPDQKQLLSSLVAMASQPKPKISPTSEQFVVEQPNMQPVQNNMIQEEARTLVNPQGRTILGNILNTVGNLTGINAMNAAVDSVKLNNLSNAQKILGEEPVQPTTRYEKRMAAETARINSLIEMNKLNETHAQNYLDKVGELPKFSGEELKQFTAIDEMSNAGGKLLKRLEQDPEALRTLGLPNDPYGQQTLLWANKVAANRKFFQGGTALTAMENKAIEALVAKRGLGALFQNPETAKEAISSILEKSNKVLERMDPYAGDREFITEGRAIGYSDKDILRALHKRRASTTGN